MCHLRVSCMTYWMIIESNKKKVMVCILIKSAFKNAQFKYLMYICKDIYILTAVFAMIVTLSTTQDVIVDGWSLDLLLK